MKRTFHHRRDPRLGRWLDDLARGLVREGTRARRALEASLDAWDDGSGMIGKGIAGASPIEARIRAIFAGSASIDERATTERSRALLLGMEPTAPCRYQG